LFPERLGTIRPFLWRRAGEMGRTIAIVNQKGGTGKTTTAVNLSAGIAKKGFSVLLVDLDPQAHASYGLGVDLDEDQAGFPTIAMVLSEERGRIRDAIIDTVEPNLKLVPSDIRLAKAAALLHTRNFRESVLNNALRTASEFDYIIIDCQPSLDVLCINALVAADRILVPTQLAGHALRGLSDLVVTINSIKGETEAYDWRILLTMMTGLGQERQENASKILMPLAARILKTRIHRTEAIEKSQMETEDENLTPVIMRKQWNRGARDYRSLVREILELWPL
jgi:chromosome partitioning protein